VTRAIFGIVDESRARHGTDINVTPVLSASTVSGTPTWIWPGSSQVGWKLLCFRYRIVNRQSNAEENSATAPCGSGRADHPGGL